MSRLPLFYRLVMFLALLPIGLTGCTDATATRVDDRTFIIEGPPVPGGAEGPNRRMAEQRCPKGYRVLDQARRKIDASIGTVTFWTIRCL